MIPHDLDPTWAKAYNVEARATPGKSPGFLHTTFKVTGPIHDLALPVEIPAKRLERHQELWKHSCFEIFATAGAGSTEYFEWNLSSSAEWGHFRFSAYREAQGNALDFTGAIEDLRFAKNASSLELNAIVNLFAIHQLRVPLERGEKIRLGLTCILENKRGEKSHWALRHGAERPDFHSAETFALNYP